MSFPSGANNQSGWSFGGGGGRVDVACYSYAAIWWIKLKHKIMYIDRVTEQLIHCSLQDWYNYNHNTEKRGCVLLVSAGNVVEDRMSRLARASLVEYVEALQWLELVFLVHVVLRHYLLELCARHVHTAPPGGRHDNRWRRHRLNSYLHFLLHSALLMDFRSML